MRQNASAAKLYVRRGIVHLSLGGKLWALDGGDSVTRISPQERVKAHVRDDKLVVSTLDGSTTETWTECLKLSSPAEGPRTRVTKKKLETKQASVSERMRVWLLANGKRSPQLCFFVDTKNDGICWRGTLDQLDALRSRFKDVETEGPYRVKMTNAPKGEQQLRDAPDAWDDVAAEIDVVEEDSVPRDATRM